MTDDEFWRIIDDARGPTGSPLGDAYGRLDQLLRARPPGDVVAFDHHFSRMLERANTNLVAGAFYVFAGGLSTDGFWDFRTGLIAHGRTFFENVLRDPDNTIADLPKDEADQLWAEGYQYIAERVYADLVGAEMPRSDAEPFGPRTGPDFSEEDEDLERQYPRLFDRYG